MWVGIGNDKVVKTLLGYESIEEAYKTFIEDNETYKRNFRAVRNREFYMSVRANCDYYNGESRIKYTVMSCYPFSENFEKELKQLDATIASYKNAMETE